MRVAALWRYPVKSMLGEQLDSLDVDERGARGDRTLALIDVATGRVASAKQPRLWRSLLRCFASGDPGEVRITVPGGQSVRAGVDSDRVDEVLTELFGRHVRLSAERGAGASVERPEPDDVLDHGVDADIESAILEIGEGTPGESFVDYAPLHLVTTATLRHVGVDAVRYRPNLVIETPADVPPFVENDWVGQDLIIGDGNTVRLRGSVPTPRCALPTLEHGDLPREPQAVRLPAAENRRDLPGIGDRLPCAGVYLDVLDGGTIVTGASVSIEPAA